MNYLELLNRFYDLLQCNYLSNNAQLLYHTLLMINNRCSWTEWFQRTNVNLCGLMGIGEKAFINARNELKQAELIDFIASKKRGECTKYKILYPSKAGTKEVQRKYKGSTNAVQTTDINKYKTKTETEIKENIIKEKFFDNEKMNASFEEWLKYKTERKEKYTDTGLNKLVSQINNQLKIYSVDEVVDLIDLCMSRNYKGIIFDILKKPKNEIPDWAEEWLKDD